MEPKEIISSGILELYCMGLSSPAENAQVEVWASQYQEVAAEISAIRAGMEKYAQTHAVEPGKAVKEKLFEQINKSGFESGGKATIKDIGEAGGAKIRTLSAWKWTAAAAVLLLIGSAVTNVIFYNKYTEAGKDLSATRQELAQEQSHAKEMKHDMDIVHNPYSMPVALKGMDPMPDATAKIFWMQNTGEVMIDASNLPDAPAGHQYQFWAIVDGTPVNGGMIVTNDKGIKFRMQQMKTFGKAQAFAISLEKEGGNPTPTKVVSMGKI